MPRAADRVLEKTRDLLEENLVQDDTDCISAFADCFSHSQSFTVRLRVMDSEDTGTLLAAEAR